MQIIKKDEINEDDYGDDEDEDGIDKISAAIFIIKCNFLFARSGKNANL